MNDLRELFKKQLDISTPCDGDYLKGRTIEEAANELFAEYNVKGVSLSLEKIQENVKLATEDWKLHKGEKALIVAELTNGKQAHGTIEITRVWESELEKYVDKPFVRHMGDQMIPQFDMGEEE